MNFVLSCRVPIPNKTTLNLGRASSVSRLSEAGVTSLSLIAKSNSAFLANSTQAPSHLSLTEYHEPRPAESQRKHGHGSVGHRDYDLE